MSGPPDLGFYQCRGVRIFSCRWMHRPVSGWKRIPQPRHAPSPTTFTAAAEPERSARSRVREVSSNDNPARFVTGAMDDGNEVLIDRRAAARLPSRFGLTLRGIGPFKHLALELEAEQWGRLLYD